MCIAGNCIHFCFKVWQLSIGGKHLTNIHMKSPVAVDPGKDGSVRITISCHNKEHFANNNLRSDLITIKKCSDTLVFEIE